MKRLFKYLQYVFIHKWLVARAGLKYKVPILNLIFHDWDKFLPGMMNAYSRTFRDDAGNKQYKPHKRFNYEWLRHIQRNKHHWQHWILKLDDGGEVLIDMPEQDVREMVADWTGAGKALKSILSCADWYMLRRDTIKLSDPTRALVDELLGIDELPLRQINSKDYVLPRELYDPDNISLEDIRSFVNPVFRPFISIQKGKRIIYSTNEQITESWFICRLPPYLAAIHFLTEPQSNLLLLESTEEYISQAIFGFRDTGIVEYSKLVKLTMKKGHEDLYKRLLNGEALDKMHIQTLDHRLVDVKNDKIRASQLLWFLKDDTIFS